MKTIAILFAIALLFYWLSSPRIYFGFHWRGLCWKFRFSKRHFYEGDALTIIAFWRFYIGIDRHYRSRLGRFLTGKHMA